VKPTTLLTALLLSIAPVSALAGGKAPSPEEARACVISLGESLRSGPVRSRDLERWFTPPSGPLSEGPEGVALDQARLLALLDRQGPLGVVLRASPGIEAVVQGPDYTRVVLATEPYLSFLLVRDGNGALIERWETTRCGDCREPVRFVHDLLASVRDGSRPVLLPGRDLHLPRGVEATDPQQALWNHAFIARNLSAGYLRWLLHDAEVLGQEMGGVRIAYRDAVETWPVVYRDGSWGLEYEQLPPDSPLRLERSEVSSWREEAHVRQLGREWWTPLDRDTPDRGELWAQHAVGVAWQPLQQRWLLALERPDGLLAGLFALEVDGEVSQRWELPHWPDRLAKPVRFWPRNWVLALSPSGREALLGGAKRWWLVGVEERGIALGPRGLIGTVQAAAWSDDARWLALGDDGGNVALIPAGEARPSTIRYRGDAEGLRAGVTGLAVLPGGGSLLVLWEDGALQRMAIPGLEPIGEPASLCCGRATGLGLQEGRGEALVACGGACPPLASSRVSLYGEQAPDQYGDVVLSPAGGVVSVSPDGRWVVLAAAAAGGSAALCQGHDLAPVAVFSEIPLVQVAWSDDGQALLALREDGSAVHWTLESILAGGALR
jgi:hypothetical protein